MIKKLEDLHTSNLKAEKHDVYKRLYRSRMTEGMSVERHVTAMIGDIERLGELGNVMEAEMSISLIL